MERLMGILKIFFKNKWEEIEEVRIGTIAITIYLVLSYGMGHIIMYIFKPEKEWSWYKTIVFGILPLLFMLLIIYWCYLFVKWIIANWKRAVNEYNRKIGE